MKSKVKMPRQYKLSEEALKQRKTAARKRRKSQGRTAFRAINVPEMMLSAFDAVKMGDEPYWRTITRAIQALNAIKSMRGKLETQGDPEIRGLARFLEGCQDGDDGAT